MEELAHRRGLLPRHGAWSPGVGGWCGHNCRVGSAFSMIVGSGHQLGATPAATCAFPGMPGGTYQACTGQYCDDARGRRNYTRCPWQSRYSSNTNARPSTTLTKEDVDKARKATAKASIWIFVALLTGALCASLAATLAAGSGTALPTASSTWVGVRRRLSPRQLRRRRLPSLSCH